jgi:DNA-binding LacI/PurR family transcriptional regulator
LRIFEDSDVAKGKTAGARASMQNVAAYAGVSIATVSKVMQGVTTVLPENVTKVQNAIEALGYRINPLGAELRRGRRNLIGLIVPDIEKSGTARLITELELAVEAKNHVLFVASSHQSPQREADLANRMQDWRVAGVVIVPISGQTGDAALLIADSGVPAVYVQATVPRKAQFDTIIANGEMRHRDVALKAVSMIFERLDKPDASKAIVRL